MLVSLFQLISRLKYPSEFSSDRIKQDIGIQEGDVILQINRIQVNDASDVKRAFDYYQGRATMRMLFERGGQTYYTDFVIE